MNTKATYTKTKQIDLIKKQIKQVQKKLDKALERELQLSPFASRSARTTAVANSSKLNKVKNDLEKHLESLI